MSKRLEEYNNDLKFTNLYAIIKDGDNKIIETIKSSISSLVESNKIVFEESFKEKEDKLDSLFSRMVDNFKETKTEAQEDGLRALLPAKETESMVESSSIITPLKEGMGALKDILVNVQNLGSFMSERGIEKSDLKNLTIDKKPETKIITSDLNKKERSGNLLEASIDESVGRIIGEKMGDALERILKPLELIKSFFTFILPKLIILGILIYAVVTGYFDVTFTDFVITLSAFIIGAVVSYIAWKMIKDGILLGIQITAEMLKVSMWAVPVALAIAGIALVVVSFLAIGLIVVALVGVVLFGLYKIFQLIGKDLFETVQKVILGVVSMVGKVVMSIVGVVSKIVTLIPNMVSSVFGFFKDVILTIPKLILGMMGAVTGVMISIVSKIVDVFSVIKEYVSDKIILGVFSIVSWVGNFFKTTVDKVTTTINSFFSFLNSVLDMVSGAVSKLFKSVMSFFGGGSSRTIESNISMETGDAFKQAIMPLIETGIQIKEILRELVDSVKGKKEDVVISTNTLNNSSLNSGDRYINDYEYNTFSSTDASDISSGIRRIYPQSVRVGGGESESIRGEDFNKYMESLLKVLESIDSKTKRNETGGLFGLFS